MLRTVVADEDTIYSREACIITVVMVFFLDGRVGVFSSI
jgi:hypothetical protein